jgi:hypothetical protein
MPNPHPGGPGCLSYQSHPTKNKKKSFATKINKTMKGRGDGGVGENNKNNKIKKIIKNRQGRRKREYALNCDCEEHDFRVLTTCAAGFRKSYRLHIPCQ